MAKWPYNTGAWQRLRQAKLNQCPVCFVCEMRGRIEQANTVDHIKPISQGGDPFPGLDQLMALCQRCHNEKTSAFDRTHGNTTGRRFKGCDAKGNPIDPADGWNTGQNSATPQPRIRVSGAIPFGLKRSSIPVVIVCGPPASGKTTYVRDNAAAGDTVIDFDECLQMAGGTWWGWDCSLEIKKKAFDIRNQKLRSLSRRRRGRAWFILTAPGPEDRAEWCRCLGNAVVIVLATDEAICIERIRANPQRAPQSEAQIHAVMKWWRVYQTGAGEITGDHSSPYRHLIVAHT